MPNLFTYHAHGLLEITEVDHNGGWSYFKATTGCRYGGQTNLIAPTPGEAKDRYEAHLRSKIAIANGVNVECWQQNLDRLLR